MQQALPGDRGISVHQVIKILSSGIVLCLLQIPIRTQITGASNLFVYWYDTAFTAILTCLFLFFAFLIRTKTRLLNAFVRTFQIICLSSIFIALANTKAVRILGRPLNYQWFHYSDFPSSEAWSAISVLFSWMLFGSAIACSMILLLIPALLEKCMTFHRKLLVGATVLLTAYLFVGCRYHGHALSGPPLLDNPVFSFVRSAVLATNSPELFTSATRVSWPDRFADESSIYTTLTGPEVEISRVVVVVLESVSAEYMDFYGGSYGVTPEAKRYLNHAALFDHIYTPVPLTNHALVSMDFSVYPWFSFASLTEDPSPLPHPSLSQLLQKRGYRTGFFNGADNRYQNVGEFLRNNGFMQVSDSISLDCRQPKFTTTLEGITYVDGTDDQCLFESLIPWLQQPGPSFSILWTRMTHFPYFPSEPEIEYTSDPFFNKYLNALSRTDQLLSRFMDDLKKKKLFDSTLVVIVGDHGEEFGRHGAYGHGNVLYEESVHVPMLLVNPKLFHGERYSRVGSLIDLAPTVFQILGYSSPREWQGSSLLSNEYSKRAYFFSPMSGFIFGYRDQQSKFILDALTNSVQCFDLIHDPREMKNIAGHYPVDPVGIQHLASWAQTNNEYMRKLMRGRKPIRKFFNRIY